MIDMEIFLEGLNDEVGFNKYKYLGEYFIYYFELYYDETDSEHKAEWLEAMNTCYSMAKEINIYVKPKPLAMQKFDRWFFCACADPEECMSKPVCEKVDDYVKFYHYLDIGYSIEDALKVINK